MSRKISGRGLKRSVLVVATSDQPAMLRMKCPLVATTIAEYFKDQGKDVLLMMDSPICDGAKGDRTCDRRAAGCKRIYTLDLCGISEIA